MKIYVNDRHQVKALYHSYDVALVPVETDVFDGWPQAKVLCYCHEEKVGGAVSVYPYLSWPSAEAAAGAGAKQEKMLAELGAPATEDQAGRVEDILQAMFLVNDAIPVEYDYLTRALYPEWDGGSVPYTLGFKVLRGGQAYKCRQAHNSQGDWPPETTPALWAAIDETHSGTKDDPIPAVSGMAFKTGLYYIEPEAPEAVYVFVWPADMPWLHWGPGQFHTLVEPEGSYFREAEK